MGRKKLFVLLLSFIMVCFCIPVFADEAGVETGMEAVVVPDEDIIIDNADDYYQDSLTAQNTAEGNSKITWVKGSLPVACNNTNVGLRKKSYISSVSDGYMRVFFDGEKIWVEYYDTSFKLLRQGTIPLELDIWGGFYAGSDGCYYVVEGRNNTAENDSAEVIRVIKYDSNWNRVKAASITGNTSLFGGQVRYPFDYGTVQFAEDGNYLFVVTGHEGYMDAQYGQGHQGFLMARIDKTNMTGNIVDTDLWHSFAQYIKSAGDYLYVLELSEGSRYTKLSRFASGGYSRTNDFSVLNYGGSRDSAWAIPCYASVDDLEMSSGYVIGAGTSIDQSKYDSVSSDTPHNIYLTITPKSNFSNTATTVKWLTNYSSGGKTFVGLHLTKISGDRIMVSWEESPAADAALASNQDSLSGGILHYLFIDGKGDVISQEYTAAATISDCQPIVKGGKVIYYASNENMVDFYTIDAQTGKFDKVQYRIAGDAVSWDFKDGTLTFSGKGDIKINTEYTLRVALSRVSSVYFHSGDDNVWSPLRGSVTKISIGKGIVSIPANAFSGFESLTQVDLPDGLKSIGEQAFYSCSSLSELYIPDSVAKIGDDILWTGYYWTHDNSHVVYATISGSCSAYAAKYAEKNGITFNTTHALKKVSKTSPTCTQNGNIAYYACSKCGNLYKDKNASQTLKKSDITLAATGHSYGAWTVTKKATTKKTGLKERTCENCGKVQTKKLAKLKKNPMTIGTASKTFKASSLKKSAKTFSIGVKKAKGKVTYTLNKKAKTAKIKVSKKGKVTVPKKCEKGTYKIVVKAAGTSKYAASKKTVTITVKQ